MIALEDNITLLIMTSVGIGSLAYHYIRRYSYITYHYISKIYITYYYMSRYCYITYNWISRYCYTPSFFSSIKAVYFDNKIPIGCKTVLLTTPSPPVHPYIVHYGTIDWCPWFNKSRDIDVTMLSRRPESCGLYRKGYWRHLDKWLKSFEKNEAV